MCRNLVEFCDEDDVYELTLHKSDLYTTYLHEDPSSLHHSSSERERQDCSLAQSQCRHTAHEVEHIKAKTPALLGRTTLLANAKLLEQDECPQFWSW
jgi:hypothetical protein